MILTIDAKYDFEQIVYQKTDVDQKPGIITEISVTPGGALLYGVSQGPHMNKFYAFELSDERNVLVTSTH